MIDRALLERVCRELAYLLASSNVQASELALKHAALLQQGLGQGFAVMQVQIDSFDYAQALAQLRVTAGALQIQLPVAY